MNESVNDLSKPSATNSATASSTPSATAERPKGVVVKRVMGQVRAEEAGPSLVVVAGIHGNEPAGVEAGRRVLARLAQGDVGLRGELVILGGNVAALRTGARYLKRALSRAASMAASNSACSWSSPSRVPAAAWCRRRASASLQPRLRSRFR